eukprot:gb/GFBE01081239.1/.p1 GENE.gb/GFBE01081239.1/~~gb/GFBE01081239.1/.p1  ORF type:complete len:188 (+),score=20.54 gb/GFBE01081239.1/:1-564(+)
MQLPLGHQPPGGASQQETLQTALGRIAIACGGFLHSDSHQGKNGARCLASTLPHPSKLNFPLPSQHLAKGISACYHWIAAVVMKDFEGSRYDILDPCQPDMLSGLRFIFWKASRLRSVTLRFSLAGCSSSSSELASAGRRWITNISVSAGASLKPCLECIKALSCALFDATLCSISCKSHGLVNSAK